LCVQGKGASRQALLKYMMQNFSLGQDESSVNTHLKSALKHGLEKGDLQNTTGKGVVGNIRLLKAKTTKAAKKPAPAAKKPKNKDKVEEAIKKHPTPWPPRSWQEPTPPWNQDKKGAKKPAKNATASKAKAAAAAKAKAKKQAAAAKAKAAAAAKVKKPAKKRKNPVK